MRNKKLRDKIAIEVMKKLLVDPWYEEQAFKDVGASIAADAYEMADFMLAERRK